MNEVDVLDFGGGFVLCGSREHTLHLRQLDIGM
jgi:hypothetical protein